MSAAYSQAARDYFDAHAIAPELAATVGVHERAGQLRFPCAAADGLTYYRERSLNGGPAKVKQPPGRPLALWWPLGRPRRAEAVLVSEGESDALAALEPLSESRFGALEVVAIPGAGFPPKRLAEQLAEAGVREAFLAFDGDTAGRAYAAKAAAALGAAGISSIVVDLEDGTDLAENLAQAEDRTRWIENALADAEAAADEIAAPPTQSSAGPLPPFPAEALPSSIADWAKATATATQTPVDLSAGMALSALSTAALSAATVRCAPGWEEELAFWAVCVLPSGERKSAVLRAALEPVREVEHDRLTRRDGRRLPARSVRERLTLPS